MTRLTLASVPDSRDETRLKDAWGSNCYIEKDENDLLWTVKRPGTINAIDVIGTGALGQGIFTYGNLLIVIQNDTMIFLNQGFASFDLSWTAGTPGDLTFIGAPTTSVNSIFTLSLGTSTVPKNTWVLGADYDYDDFVYEDDGTGYIRKFYVRSKQGAKRKRPSLTGWEKYLWGTSRLSTTDRWEYQYLSAPTVGDGNTQLAAQAAWLALGLPDVTGTPSYPRSGVDGLGRNWTETLTSADLLPYQYRTLIVYDPNPPYPGASINFDYSLSVGYGPGSFYKTA